MQGLRVKNNQMTENVLPGKAALGSEKNIRALRPRTRSTLGNIQNNKSIIMDGMVPVKSFVKKETAFTKPESLYDEYQLNTDELAELKGRRQKRNAIRAQLNSDMCWNLFDRVDGGEYQDENFNFLQDRELSMIPLCQDFLQKSATIDITPRMRYILINWLVSVHQSYKLSPESLYLTVALMDRYVQRSKEPLSKDLYQLLGLTAMFVATKFEEMYPPDIRDFTTISDGAFSKKQLRAFEKTLLTTLDFNISLPQPIYFLRRYTSYLGAESHMHNMAKYFLELSLTEYELSHLSGNLRASVAVCLAKALSDGVENVSSCWTPILVYLSSYTFEELELYVRILAKAAYRQNSPSRYRAIHNKYQCENLCGVADLPVMRSRLLEAVAQLQFDEDGQVVE